MSYTHTTLAAFRDALEQRLHDPANERWSTAELTEHINTALRMWGALTRFWRDRDQFNTTASEPFYDVQTQLSALCGLTVTDRQIITPLCYHLAEKQPSGAWAWQGTSQFTLAELTSAIQQRRDQFLLETGSVVTRDDSVAIGSPPITRVTLDSTVMDLRRVALRSGSAIRVLGRSDERASTGLAATWSSSPGFADRYSIVASPPLQIQLIPAQGDVGTLDILYLASGATLNPVASATVLGVPDDLSWAVMFGAMADLLSKDGLSADPLRAAWCESLYRMGVEIATAFPLIVHAEINGVPVIPLSVKRLDYTRVGWQGKATDTPTMLAVAGRNLVALNPVPDSAVHSVLLDVVRNAPTVSGAGDYIDVGREHLSAILDMAEVLSLVQLGGMEFDAAKRLARNFLAQAVVYNQRLVAASTAITDLLGTSSIDKAAEPMRSHRSDEDDEDEDGRRRRR